jgi:ribosomal protein S21
MSVNAEVILSPGQDAAQAWKLLHRLLMKTGTYTDAKRHEAYRKPGERKRIKSAKARRRARKNGNQYEARHLAHLDRQGLSDDTRRAAPGRGWLSAAPRIDPARVAAETAASTGS